MKKAKKIFEEELSGEPLTQESVIEAIKLAQIDAVEETVKRCAENAKINVTEELEDGSIYHKYSHKSKHHLYCSESDYYYELDKQSILTVAEELKKELE